jgi:SAM-dependent methyltransferase
VYVNPRHDEGSLREIYTETYYDHDGIKNGLEFYGYDDYLGDEDNIRITFAKRLGVIEDCVSRGRLLDVGCATGFFLDLARGKGWEVVGTEVSEFGAQVARERFGLDVRLGTLEDLRLDTGSFDCVTMWDVIEHVADPTRELEEVRRILRAGGVLSLITPDVGSPVARALGSRWEEFRRVREHIYFFSRRTMAELLRKAGFEILKAESADKVFYLGAAMHRLKYYLWDGVVTNTAADLVFRLGLDRMRININPYTKMAVYARKRE